MKPIFTAIGINDKGDALVVRSAHPDKANDHVMPDMPLTDEAPKGRQAIVAMLGNIVLDLLIINHPETFARYPSLARTPQELEEIEHRSQQDLDDLRRRHQADAD
jgi:hypothetical protein